jgi:hypothetical protein
MKQDSTKLNAQSAMFIRNNGSMRNSCSAKLQSDNCIKQNKTTDEHLSPSSTHQTLNKKYATVIY